MNINNLIGLNAIGIIVMLLSVPFITSGDGAIYAIGWILLIIGAVLYIYTMLMIKKRSVSDSSKPKK